MTTRARKFVHLRRRALLDAAPVRWAGTGADPQSEASVQTVALAPHSAAGRVEQPVARDARTIDIRE